MIAFWAESINKYSIESNKINQRKMGTNLMNNGVVSGLPHQSVYPNERVLCGGGSYEKPGESKIGRFEGLQPISVVQNLGQHEP